MYDIGNISTMNERRLRNLIDMASFAMDDARLYLDTHPDCQKGSEYFSEMQRIRDAAIKDYTRRFGPMLAYFVEADNHGKWQWNEEPMPWSACAGGGVN